MSRLKTLKWWPTAWVPALGREITAEKVRKDGVLKNVSRSSNTLTLVVDCDNATFTATVKPQLPEDSLILLQHILLQQYGQPMAVVENLDIDLQGVFPVVKPLRGADSRK